MANSARKLCEIVDEKPQEEKKTERLVIGVFCCCCCCSDHIEAIGMQSITFASL